MKNKTENLLIVSGLILMMTLIGYELNQVYSTNLQQNIYNILTK